MDEKERLHQEDLQRIRGFRLFDDDLSIQHSPKHLLLRA